MKPISLHATIAQILSNKELSRIAYSGGQRENKGKFYGGAARASKANRIAGSKFEIFSRHFAVSLAAAVFHLPFFIPLAHRPPHFWHAFQLGWLPGKPRSWSVTRTIEEVKGDCDSFFTESDLEETDFLAQLVRPIKQSFYLYYCSRFIIRFCLTARWWSMSSRPDDFASS